MTTTGNRLVPVTVGQFTGRDLHELFTPVLAHATDTAAPVRQAADRPKETRKAA